MGALPRNKTLATPLGGGVKLEGGEIVSATGPHQVQSCFFLKLRDWFETEAKTR